MKSIRLLLVTTASLAFGSLGRSAAWDISFTQFDAANKPRSVQIAPTADSFLGFGPTKQIANFAPTVARVKMGTDNRQIHGNAGSSEAFSAATAFHSVVLDESTSAFTFTDWPADAVRTITLAIQNGSPGGRVVTWPAAVVGSYEINPGADVWTFVSLTSWDGGTTIHALSTYSAAAGETATLPGGMGLVVETAKLGSLEAGYFTAGSYGTSGPQTLGDWTVVVKSLGTVANPTVDVAPGAVPSGTVVTISTTTPSAFFTSTNNGTDPGYSVGTVGNTFTVSGNGTWEYRGNKEGWISSAVQSASYTIDPIPTLTSATLQANGTDIVAAWPEAVSYGAGGSGGWALTASGGAVTVTGVTGGGTTTHTLTANRTITNAETVTIAYTQPGNGAEDSAGQDVATFSGTSVDVSAGPGGGGGEETQFVTATTGSWFTAGSDGQAGYKFTVGASAITITKVQFKRHTENYAAITVKIFDSDGTTELRSVSVPHDSVAVGEWAEASITPLVVSAGAVRHIRGVWSGYNSPRQTNNVANLTTTAAAAINDFSNASGANTDGATVELSFKYEL